MGLSGGLFFLPNYDYYEYTLFTIHCSGKYECGNKKCIELKQLCDGVDNCGDRMDEKNCKAEDVGYSVKLVGSENVNEGVVVVSGE